MAQFKIKFDILVKNEEEQDKIVSLLNGFSPEWCLLGQKIVFKTTIETSKRINRFYVAKRKALDNILKANPNDMMAKYELSFLDSNLKKEDLVLSVSFVTDLICEVDVEKNNIMYYNGPKKERITHRNVHSLKKYIENERLDDFYEESVRRLVFCLIMTMVLVSPEYGERFSVASVFFDEEEVQTDRYLDFFPCHDSFCKHKEIYTSKLTANQTYNWIKEFTNMYNQNNENLIAFSTLTYVLNRYSYESLLYSVIGLESIYTPNVKGISYNLQKRINSVFPTITKDQIKDIYTARSKFVHGEFQIETYLLILDQEFVNETNEDASTLANALLFESVRKLILNNSSKIEFKEEISYRYK